jgi:hypothetical protein
MQYHSHHRPTRPLLAVRRTLLGRMHQARTMQMQLGHRAAQDVVGPFDQLFGEMLDREVAPAATGAACDPHTAAVGSPAMKARSWSPFTNGGSAEFLSR